MVLCFGFSIVVYMQCIVATNMISDHIRKYYSMCLAWTMLKCLDGMKMLLVNPLPYSVLIMEKVMPSYQAGVFLLDTMDCLPV